MNKEGQLILLDSFDTGRQIIDSNTAWKLIENTVNSSNGTRIERVGIVKRDNPGYRII